MIRYNLVWLFYLYLIKYIDVLNENISTKNMDEYTEYRYFFDILISIIQWVRQNSTQNHNQSITDY